MTSVFELPTVLPAMATPHEAVSAMLARLVPVAAETVGIELATARLLAEPVCADRDSPAADVSAMDGYAVRACDCISAKPLPVVGEVVTGTMPTPLRSGTAMRIFTGGVIPLGADAVVRREWVQASCDEMTLISKHSVSAGDHIRRRGENASFRDVVLEAGTRLSPAAIASASCFGAATLRVHRKVRVAVMVTGDEVGGGVDAARPRDANGPALRAMLSSVPWCDLFSITHQRDDEGLITRSLHDLIEQADVVLITGGVSMGDHDHVPRVVSAVCDRFGGEAIYHKLLMRPGKPNLGAVIAGNRAVVALPGNPVSVLVGAVVLAGPVLRRLGGYVQESAPPCCMIGQASNKTLGMWWYRPGAIDASGRIAERDHRGSGDVAGVGRTGGFFEVPPDELADAAPRRWFTWEIDPA